MKPFWLAWQFLTRFPAPSYAEVAPVEVGRSQLWYPLVGLGLGGLLYGAGHLLQLTHLPALAAAALLLSLWVAMTGALHLDGLADTMDAWVGGHADPERSLAIMKDPAAGPMGVTALVLLLLLKFSLLAAWPHGLPVAVILVPALARAAVPLLFRALPYLRGEGLGRALADHLPLGGFLLLWTPLLLLAWFGIGNSVVWLLLTLLFGVVLLGLLYKRRFNGLTGDMVGAAIEIIETVLLLTLVLLR
jgi:adenosylcobinamide-GDP ribazoletransferase